MMMKKIANHQIIRSEMTVMKITGEIPFVTIKNIVSWTIRRSKAMIIGTRAAIIILVAM
jgi:hypothetical protein